MQLAINSIVNRIALKKIVKTPWLEATIMIAAFIITTIALILISIAAEKPVDGSMPTETIVIYLIGFFLISFAIALISVVVGIGGGVLFTPIMLAFTSVDSLIIRATGLIVAMFSGLISTGVFMKKGLGNLKLCLILATSQSVGGFLGAQGAIIIYKHLGMQGEASIRVLLGIILVLIGIYFLSGGKKLEYPTVKKVDRFTNWLDLSQSYYEESEDKIVNYKLTRAGIGLFCTFLIGLIGGFFGMGGGWAITPVQNLLMGAPLKVAAANSGVILGMVDCVTAWPYILTGAIIPLFVLPWLAGQVLGGYLGGLLLVKVRVAVMRILLIGIMFFTSFGLITKGLELFKIINPVSPQTTLGVLAFVTVVTTIAIIKTQRR